MSITNLTYFFNAYISFLYMFRATQCSSSGESIVSKHHLVYRVSQNYVNTQIVETIYSQNIQDMCKMVYRTVSTCSSSCLTFSHLMAYIYIYMCLTAPLTSRCCTLYIYSTNIRTEYFKHAALSPFFPLQNAFIS